MKTSIIVAIIVAIATIMLQQTLTKVIIGISIKVAKPFKEGDSIIVHQGMAEIASGKVMAVGLMRTKIKSYEQNVYIIPNSVLDTCTVTNIDYETGINHIETIQLDTSQSMYLDQLVSFIKETLIHHSGTQNTADNTYITYKLNGSKIVVSYNVRTLDIAASYDISSEITKRILDYCSYHKIQLG